MENGDSNVRGQARGPTGPPAGSTGRSMSTVSLAAVVFAGSIAIALAIWLYIRYVKPTRTVLVPGTDRLIDTARETKILFTAPDMRNGNNYTVSCWLYVRNHSEVRKNDRHILTMGPVSLKLDKAAPTLSVTDTDFGELLPTRRWVHLAVVVTDHTGHEILLYVDGDLVERKVTPNPDQMNSSDNGISSLLIGDAVKGDAKDLSGFEGVVTRVALANYERGQGDISAEYSKGPRSGLAKYGFGWGVRSPLYKL